jgi:hypothetical protein
MRRVTRLRGKLTFANAMSVIAVFIALGGVGYAAFKLPKNSVGPKQIRNGAVNEAKLSAGAKAALKGAKGDQGQPGPGATSFATTLGVGTANTVIATAAASGITVRASCNSGPQVILKIGTTNMTNTIQVSGTENEGALTTVPQDADNSPGSVQVADANVVDLDVLARDKNVGPFSRIDVHGHSGSTCNFWGMITPSA